MIFDTCIWVGLATEQIPSNAVVKAAGEEPVFVSVISLGELAFGVESCPDPAKRIARTRYLRALEKRPTVDVTASTAAAFGLLAAFMKQIGRSPRTRVNDLWLAAQAIENDFPLLTLNVQDFAGLPGLKVVEP